MGWWIYRFFFWGATGVLAYDMYKAYNHKGKSPVENAPGVVPYFIGPAKWLVNGFNDAVEVPPRQLSSSRSRPARSCCTIRCTPTCTPRPSS